MPKMKSHSGAKKRFKKLASGKLKRAKAYHRHHGWAKTAKQTRQLRGAGYFAEGDAKKMGTLLPY